MGKIIHGFIITVFVLCVANLIPYIMSLFMLISPEGTITFNILSAIKSLFNIPTSLVLFIIKDIMGEVLWIISNIILSVVSFFLIKS